MKFGQKNSFNCVKEIDIQSNKYNYFSLAEAEKKGLSGISKLPNSLKVLLENLLRFEDNLTVDKKQILAIKTVNPLTICNFGFSDHVKFFLKKKNMKGSVKKTVKKYLAQVI